MSAMSHIQPMTTQRKAGLQLVLAILVLGTAIVLLWYADAAAVEQQRVLRGCWPAAADVDSGATLTVNFWREHVVELAAEADGFDAVDAFFHMRVNHRIVLYLVVLASLIGWSGSVFRRIVAAQAKAIGWDVYLSSFVLSGIGALALFWTMIGGRLLLDPGGRRCISDGYGYLVAVAGLTCGLFVNAFFDWLEKVAPRLWENIGFGTSRPTSSGGQ